MTGRCLRVLVVEDYPDAADVLALLLQDYGCAVMTAADGEEGLSLARSWHPDLVLLDIGLPKLSGWDVAEALRDDPDRPLVVAVTAYGTAEHKATSREAGIDLHLTKPADPDLLLDALDRARARCRSALGVSGVVARPDVP